MLCAVGADAVNTHARVCTEVEANHRLSHDSAESDQPVLFLFPREAEGIIKQRNLVWCVPTKRHSPREHLVSAQPHITVWFTAFFLFFFWSFLFDWSALVNLGFCRKLQKPSQRYLTEVLIHAGAVIRSLYSVVFFLFGGIVFHFGSVRLQHSKSACRLEVAHLALAVESDYRFLGSSANDEKKKKRKKKNCNWPTAEIKCLSWSGISCFLKTSKPLPGR